ncbi:cytochrome P450 2H2-like isoform X1 [Dermacentor variabilis]|uniref:cytochrome P450 2H2-like isoform X1 n=1 Tax=Dermacentor variabilis TaxID=34621 RepID=UPI003F5B6B5A
MDMNVGRVQNFISYIFEWGSFWMVFTTWLTVIIAAMLAINSFREKNGGQKNKLTAPGPGAVPILGYLPFLRKPYHTTFKELSKQYGPIIKIRLGCKDVLVLNDLASIREGLSNPDVLYRPNDFIFRHLGIEGIASINGESWQVNRRYCFHVLRNLGFARKSMEKHIQEEGQCFMALLASGKQQPMLVAHALASSVANNISALVFGERYNLSDPKGRYVEGMLSKLLREAHFFSPTDFLPALRFVAARLPGTQLYAMKSVLQELAKFIRKEVQERGATMEEHADKDFIDGYLRKIEEYKGKDSYFTLSALVGSTVNFYSAATNTVRSAVLWNLYIAASDPDGLQARVQREIDAAIGREAAPAWEDRRRTPFTMACILETLRWRTTAPLGLQRAAGRDTEICGYYVTAGTMVVANLWSLHNDPLHWSEPLKYDPTRFLNADGTEVEKKPEAFLPFGAGRRQCPGEKLALMEVFLYVATTLQRFRVLPEEGKTISLATAPALISVVNEMQGLRFIPRW